MKHKFVNRIILLTAILISFLPAAVSAREYGLVLSGGGGKGAYEVGVWKALNEYGIAQKTTVMSGASVGAMNASLFACEDYNTIEEIWLNKVPEKLTSEGEFISQSGILNLIDLTSLKDLEKKNYPCIYADSIGTELFIFNSLYYFHLNKLPVKQIQDILLASSAIPLICEPIELKKGVFFSDGGNELIGGNNTPFYPVVAFDDVPNNIDTIIIVTLSEKEMDLTILEDYNVIMIQPSEYLGGLIFGTLNFDKTKIQYLIDLGYTDTVSILEKNGFKKTLPVWFED